MSSCRRTHSGGRSVCAVWMSRRAWSTLLVVALTPGLVPVVGGGPGWAAAATAEEPTAASWGVGRPGAGVPGAGRPGGEPDQYLP
jgi:hypothetical protein